jgi:hypothetical protein
MFTGVGGHDCAVGSGSFGISVDGRRIYRETLCYTVRMYLKIVHAYDSR